MEERLEDDEAAAHDEQEAHDNDEQHDARDDDDHAQCGVDAQLDEAAHGKQDEQCLEEWSQDELDSEATRSHAAIRAARDEAPKGEARGTIALIGARRGDRRLVSQR
jgi:hypothetical protein